MENESSIKDIITNSLQQIRTIIDADTVVGKQIVTESGTVIIPISKVSMGFASGGVDLPTENSDGTRNFGGGGGTGVTVSPIGFLTVTSDGKVSMLPITPDKGTAMDQVFDLINQAPELIKRVKNAVLGDRAEEDEAAKELEKTEAEIAKQLEEELAKTQPLTKKEERRNAKEAKKAAKAEKKAAKVAAKVALEKEDDEEDELI